MLAKSSAVCGDIGQGGDELTGLEAKARRDRRLPKWRVADMPRRVRQRLFVEAGPLRRRSTSTSTCSVRQSPGRCSQSADGSRAGFTDAMRSRTAATGKGNDQVRFELTYKALAPELPVIAPWREWDLISREDCIEYAAKHNVPIAQSTTKIYSRDRNIWHISHEGGELEDPANAAPDHIWMLTSSPKDSARQVRKKLRSVSEKGIPGFRGWKEARAGRVARKAERHWKQTRCGAHRSG